MAKKMINKEVITKETKPVFFKQAVVGLELGSTDQGILNYLNFFSQKIAIESSLFIKILPVFDLYKSMFEKKIPTLSDSLTANDEICDQLKKKVQEHFLENYTELNYMVEEGNTLDEILSVAKDLKADLLVIGHKENKERQNIIGKNFIRQTTTTSLIIPEHAKPQLSNILVPVDFSDDSKIAIQEALRIQKQMEYPVKIVGLHIYKMSNSNLQNLSTSWTAFKEAREKNIKEGFNAFLYTALGENADQVEMVLQEAEHQDIPASIQSFAKKNQSDLIIIGARGHSKVHLLLMGSTTESLLDRNRDIPMMITKL